MTKKRLIIIGLDGVPYPMLKDFADQGIMPNTAQLIQNGFLTAMNSAIPEISCVAWSSIITGTNAGQHGIFGFTDLHPQTYRLKFPNYTDLKSPPFWDRCPGKSIILNVPSTYPVKAMNGVHVSGFVSIDIHKSVYPTSLVSDLNDMDYRLDVDAQKAHSDMSFFLEDLDQTLTARIKATEYLWNYTDWQVFMTTFTGTDRLMHFLYAAYEDVQHKYHEHFLDHFRKIDGAIGRIASNLKPHDTLMMLSDHGFCKLEEDVYVNHVLMTEGLLHLQSGLEPSLSHIISPTVAFALDPGRLYVNLKGKYPQGCVEPHDLHLYLDKLEHLFMALKIDGQSVIKQVYRKEQVYSGPCLDAAPDLILLPEKEFNLKGSLASTTLTGQGPFTGKHTYENAFLYVSDPSLASSLSDKTSVVDAGKLIQHIVAE